MQIIDFWLIHEGTTAMMRKRRMSGIHTRNSSQISDSVFAMFFQGQAILIWG